MQLAAATPELLRAPSPHGPASARLLADRATYAGSLRGLAPHHPDVGGWVLRVQTARDVDYRWFFLRGVMTAGIHATMARAGRELKAFAPLEGAGQGTGQEVEPLWWELGWGVEFQNRQTAGGEVSMVTTQGRRTMVGKW
jgi:hypothetical protein